MNGKFISIFLVGCSSAQRASGRSNNNNEAGGAMSSNQDNPWIYHERQEAQLCGQHALNNLAQIPNCFAADYLASIAHELAALELSMYDAEERRIRMREGSHYVDDSGNFSIEVLKVATEQKLGVALVATSPQNQDITTFQGFLCHKSDHWFAIRNIGGRFWNLNSTLERPEVVSHFTLGSEMEGCRGQGYTVFLIQTGLPEGGVKMVPEGVGNWHRMSDLLNGRSSQPDPWENMTGKGQRLDGTSTGRNTRDIDSLSDDELLQMALQQSLAPQVMVPQVMVPQEPPKDATNAVRIQFRLPTKPRVVRRFYDTDTVAGVYAFCESVNDSRAVHLQYGFPPKDLASLRDKTIAEANLANETIQGRNV
jgi:Ataxin-3